MHITFSPEDDKMKPINQSIIIYIENIFFAGGLWGVLKEQFNILENVLIH